MITLLKHNNKTIGICSCGTIFDTSSTKELEPFSSNTHIYINGSIKPNSFPVHTADCPSCGVQETKKYEEVLEISFNETNDYISISLVIENVFFRVSEKDAFEFEGVSPQTLSFNKMNGGDFEFNASTFFSTFSFSNGKFFIPFEIFLKQETKEISIDKNANVFISKTTPSDLSFLPIDLLERILAAVHKEEFYFSYKELAHSISLEKQGKEIEDNDKSILIDGIMLRDYLNRHPNNHYLKDSSFSSIPLSNHEFQELLDHTTNRRDFFRCFAPVISKRGSYEILPLLEQKSRNYRFPLYTLSVFNKPETINNLIRTINSVNEDCSSQKILLSSSLPSSTYVTKEEYTISPLYMRELISEVLDLDKMDNTMNHLLKTKDTLTLLKDKLIKFHDYITDSINLILCLKERIAHMEDKLKDFDVEDFPALMSMILFIKESLKKNHYKNIWELHDGLSKVYQKTVSDFYDFPTYKFIEVDYKEEGYTLRSPRNTKELLKYGSEQMGICVPMYNDALMKNDSTFILFLINQDDVAEVCIELDRSLDDFSVLQVKKAKNKVISDQPIDASIRKVMKQFLSNIDFDVVADNDLVNVFI